MDDLKLTGKTEEELKGEDIGSTERQAYWWRGYFLCLLRGDLTAETESKTAAAQDQVLQTNVTQQRYWKQKQIAHAHCVNNMLR
jgi:hypothetical protein